MGMKRESWFRSGLIPGRSVLGILIIKGPVDIYFSSHFCDEGWGMFKGIFFNGLQLIWKCCLWGMQGRDRGVMGAS